MPRKRREKEKEGRWKIVERGENNFKMFSLFINAVKKSTLFLWVQIHFTLGEVTKAF